MTIEMTPGTPSTGRAQAILNAVILQRAIFKSGVQGLFSLPGFHEAGPVEPHYEVVTKG